MESCSVPESSCIVGKFIFLHMSSGAPGLVRGKGRGEREGEGGGN